MLHQRLDLGGSHGRQSVVYDARYRGTVKIEYALNPPFGREATVLRQVKYGGVTFLEVCVDGQRVTVPQWMTRLDACQFLTCGFDPVCDWQALTQLLKLLDNGV